MILRLFERLDICRPVSSLFIKLLACSRGEKLADSREGWSAEGIDVPSLIVVGGDDELKASARVLHEHLKGSRYVKIKGVRSRYSAVAAEVTVD